MEELTTTKTLKPPKNNPFQTPTEFLLAALNKVTDKDQVLFLKEKKYKWKHSVKTVNSNVKVIKRTK